jgi:hypothetical protein
MRAVVCCDGERRQPEYDENRQQCRHSSSGVILHSDETRREETSISRLLLLFLTANKYISYTIYTRIHLHHNHVSPTRRNQVGHLQTGTIALCHRSELSLTDCPPLSMALLFHSQVPQGAGQWSAGTVVREIEVCCFSIPACIVISCR